MITYLIVLVLYFLILLTISRDRSKVYVHPSHVGNSPTESQGRAKVCHNCGAEQ